METGSKRYESQSKEEVIPAHRTAPIAAIFEDCLQCFERLNSMIENTQEAEEAQFPKVDSALSKFRQWGSDTGAPRRSLDHALRRAPQLQQATEELLKDLLSTLSMTLDGVQNVSIVPTSPSADYFSSQPEFGSLGQSSPSRASSDSDSSLQQLSDDIEGCVGCLIKLVPAFKDPAPREVYSDIAAHDDMDEDVKLAKEMFPTASLSLLRRLGLANWRRRQILWSLKLRDETNLSLKGSPTKELYSHLDMLQIENPQISSHRDSIAQSTQKHSYPSPGSSHSGPPSIDESIFSKSDYFSGRSVTSVAESEQMPRIKRFNIPEPPVALRPGTTFDCDYCGQEIICGIQVNSGEEWNYHVFLDLEPYMCTFDDCLRAERTFGAREDWLQHELDHHRLRKIWFCQACDQEFDEAEDIELHLSEIHKFSDDPDQLPSMVSLCQKYSTDAVAGQPCLFCGTSSATIQAREDHIADHMEQLALTSIQAVYGLEREEDAKFSDEKASVKTAKLEHLNKFVKEQLGHIWKPQQEQLEDESAGSNVAFAEDSDNESVDHNVHLPPTTQAPAETSKRPSMKRRGDSWMKKIDAFLGDRSADEPHEEPWRSKVETFLDTKLVEDDKPQTEKLHCLRTRPPPRNKDFIGRHADFANLYENLSQPGSSVVVSGAGGMGKSDTAIEFTYCSEEAYSYIFWVSAETPISCADTYARIATDFIISSDDTSYSQDRLISLGREFLEQTEMRWLLVFDNVNSWSDIEQYIPMQHQKTSGSILITARTSDVVDSTAIPGCLFLELKPLTLEESRLFLLRSMEPDLKIEKMGLHPEYNLAGVIAKESEGLPLALRHIAGYLQVSECTLSDFVQLWNERRRHKTLSTPKTSGTVSTHKALETVWNIGLREVTHDARELLDILAFLDGERIQRELLVDEHEEHSLEFLHTDQAFRFKRMTKELSRRNIISINTDNGRETLHIHRSLQQKILEGLDKDPRRREEVFSQAFQLVRKKFPLPSPIQVPEPAKWPACKEYLPHVLHLVNVTTNILPSIIPSVRLARLFSDGGINLWERGMTSEGLRLLKSAEAILDKLKSDESHLRANIHVIINLLIQDFGLSHITESKDRIRQALKIRLNYLIQCDPTHYTRTDAILLHNAWSDYGCVLLQHNDYQKAEPMFRKCLTKYRDWGSESDIPYEYYKYNHHVAFCRLHQHDFATAIALAEKSLHLITLATGPSSAASKTRFDLACIVLQSGDTARALALYKEVLASNLKLHGKFNFLTLQSYYSVGVVSAYTGNLIEAERWLKKALALEQSRRGSWSEVANARTEFCLSQMLTEQGKELELARQLEAQAKVVLNKLLPLNPLEGVEPGEEIALFDHLQPVFDGRFAGRMLLKYLGRGG